ncbi:MAG TPA: exodeoxyribonuclease VII small subunit [Burkholderiaceae bacterium]|nr:exodeoxyribonuclease VII small subunit [Burkholderiaceae bacterium]
MVEKTTGAPAKQADSGGTHGPQGADDLPQDFETALARLEGLVAQMEDGSLPLEQSLAAYQKGVELARICQRRLDAAEQQVRVLQEALLVPLNDATRADGD